MPTTNKATRNPFIEEKMEDQVFALIAQEGPITQRAIAEITHLDLFDVRQVLRRFRRREDEGNLVVTLYPLPESSKIARWYSIAS